MFSALLSFLGGSAFRMVWGEVAAYFSKKQEHAHEVERMKLQGDLDAAQHARNIESIKVQADMQVQVVRVQGEAAVNTADAEGFYAATKAAMAPTGIVLVDVWNGCVRPAFATVALVLWVLALNRAGWQMSEWDKELVAAVAGFFFASRELLKRGK